MSRETLDRDEVERLLGVRTVRTRLHCGCLMLALIVPFLVSLTLLLQQVTDDPPAVDLEAWLVTRLLEETPDMIRESGLDDDSIRQIVQRLAANPTGCGQPLEDVNITLCRDELGAEPSAHEVRFQILRKVMEEAYEGGAQGVVDLLEDPEGEEEGLGLLGAAFDLFSRKGHQSTNSVFVVAAPAAALVMLLLAVLSRGFGKLFWPGLIVFLGGLPLFLLSVLGLRATTEAPPAVRDWLEEFTLLIAVSLGIATAMLVLSGMSRVVKGLRAAFG